MGQGLGTPPDFIELLRAAGTALNGRRLEDVCEIDTVNRPIGAGSFGIVWRAQLTDQGAGTVVAVKAVDKGRMKERSVPHSVVLLEVELMRECVGSPEFVQFHDFIDTSGMYYFILEYCDGGNLEAAVLHGSAKLDEKQVVLLMSQMLGGIAALHSKCICHRDVKPQNFMVVGDHCGRGAQVKLGDFGLATRLMHGELLTAKAGTPAFMAPEMHLLPDGAGYDHKVDVWAIGIVMVFLLTEEYPFVDRGGEVLHDQLSEGDLQLWDADAATGVLRFVQEAVGIRRRRPSDLAVHLVRRLLMPKRQHRFSACGALHHDWFLEDRRADAGSVARGPKRDADFGLPKSLRDMCCSVPDSAVLEFGTAKSPVYREPDSPRPPKEWRCRDPMESREALVDSEEVGRAQLFPSCQPLGPPLPGLQDTQAANMDLFPTCHPSGSSL